MGVRGGMLGLVVYAEIEVEEVLRGKYTQDISRVDFRLIGPFIYVSTYGSISVYIKCSNQQGMLRVCVNQIINQNNSGVPRIL